MCFPPQRGDGLVRKESRWKLINLVFKHLAIIAESVALSYSINAPAVTPDVAPAIAPSVTPLLSLGLISVVASRGRITSYSEGC